MAKGQIPKGDEGGEEGNLTASPVTTAMRTSSAQAKMRGARAKTSSTARSPKPLMNPSALKISRKKRKSY
jgi:hypothetical protein